VTELAIAGEFTFTRLEKVIFGAGSVSKLGAELDRRELKRAVVVTGKSLGASKLLDSVTGALGARCAAVFRGISQHAPMATVRALTDELRRISADVVVSFGGGSPIDASKVAIASILNGRDMTLESGKLDWSHAMAPRDARTALTHIAIPTTLSAAEYTPAGGTTNEANRVKQGVVDARLQPAVIINDPALTLATPDWLWVATGMRALDHAVEAIYSNRHQAFTDTLAAEAIRLLFRHLPASIGTQGDEQLAHRGHCQTAAWFSLYGAINVRLGISHALGHKIGPTWNVPHGVTSCITLPHGMRFMADVAPQRFALIAHALGIDFDPADPRPAARACADRVAAFIAQFDVPHSLREAGVPRTEVSRIVAPVRDEVSFAGVVDRPVTADEIAKLLDAAYG
jgi:alcohol dehydrogenase class IV